MEYGSALAFARVLCWVIPAAAVLWLVIEDLLQKKSDTRVTGRREHFVAALLALVVLAAAAYAVQRWGAAASSGETLWINTLAGGAAALAAILLTGHLLRSYYPPADAEVADGQLDRTPESAAPIAALAMALLLGAYLAMKQTARPDEWLVAAALGAAAVVAVFTAAPARLGREGPTPCALVALEFASVAAALWAITMVVGRLHYPNDLKYAGEMGLILAVCGMLVWLPLRILQHLLFRTSSALALTAALLWFAATAGAAWYALNALNLEREAFYCWSSGLITGFLLGILNTTGHDSLRSPYNRHVSAAGVALVLAATALSLRYLAGFGVAMCASGIIASVFAWNLLAPARHRWTFRDSHSIAPLVWSSGFLTIVAGLRIWMEWAGSGRVDIYNPYPFLGLTIGMSAPFFYRFFSPDEARDRDPDMPGAVLASVLLIAAAAAIIVGVSVILRESAVSLLLVGLGAAGLAGAVTDRQHLQPPVASWSVFTAMLVLGLSESLLTLSAEAGRPEKVRTLAITMAVLVVVYLLTEGWNVLRSRREDSGAGPSAAA